MSAILSLLLALLPEAPALIQDIRDFFVKYPTITPAQMIAIVTALSTQSDAAFQDALATIAADQAAHLTIPATPLPVK
jgi:hypothetical protein